MAKETETCNLRSLISKATFLHQTPGWQATEVWDSRPGACGVSLEHRETHSVDQTWEYHVLQAERTVQTWISSLHCAWMWYLLYCACYKQTVLSLCGLFSSCPQNTTSNCIQTVDVGQGEVTWMLEAQNPLGIVKIKETADLMRRGKDCFTPSGDKAFIKH